MLVKRTVREGKDDRCPVAGGGRGGAVGVESRCLKGVRDKTGKGNDVNSVKIGLSLFRAGISLEKRRVGCCTCLYTAFDE